MSQACHSCARELDLSHDAHYRCPECKDLVVCFCPCCAPHEESCPMCGGRLDYHEASITKKVFFNPATRGQLGF